MRYGERIVFSGLGLRVDRGEKAVIIGRSGAGKTSLLALISGALAPAEGRVLVGGKPPVNGSPRVSVMPQGADLFPWMDAEANVGIGLGASTRERKERRERAMDALSKVGLGGRGAAYPRELSGGERQRVALARTFARDPDLVLMDEPFSALDAITREEMQELFLALALKRGATAVIVTHSIEEAAFLGDSVYVLSGRGELAPAKTAPRAGTAREGLGGIPFRETAEYSESVRALRVEFDARGR